MTVLFKEVLSYLKFEREGRGQTNLGGALTQTQKVCALRRKRLRPSGGPQE